MINGKKIGLIACCDISGLIGYEGNIPWYNSTDLKRFKTLTSGTTLIMGNNTFTSLPKALPSRRTHVMTNNPKPGLISFTCPKCHKRHSDEGEWAIKAHNTHRCVDDVYGTGCGSEWKMKIGAIGSIFGSSKSIGEQGEVVYYRDLLKAIEEAPTDLVWIAGGAQVYTDALILKMPDFIDLTILNSIYLPSIKDNLRMQSKKSIYMPYIDYAYRVISELQNEDDSQLFHRRYEIRPEWAWKD